jgi:hypothetical protein
MLENFPVFTSNRYKVHDKILEPSSIGSVIVSTKLKV